MKRRSGRRYSSTRRLIIGGKRIPESTKASGSKQSTKKNLYVDWMLADGEEKCQSSLGMRMLLEYCKARRALGAEVDPPRPKKRRLGWWESLQLRANRNVELSQLVKLRGDVSQMGVRISMLFYQNLHDNSHYNIINMQLLCRSCVLCGNYNDELVATISKSLVSRSSQPNLASKWWWANKGLILSRSRLHRLTHECPSD